MSDYQKALNDAVEAERNFNALVRGIDESERKSREYAETRQKLSIDSDQAVIKTSLEIKALRTAMTQESTKRDKAEKQNTRLMWVAISVASLTLIATVIGIFMR